jgi:hypothetical protein
VPIEVVRRQLPVIEIAHHPGRGGGGVVPQSASHFGAKFRCQAKLRGGWIAIPSFRDLAAPGAGGGRAPPRTSPLAAGRWKLEAGRGPGLSPGPTSGVLAPGSWLLDAGIYTRGWPAQQAASGPQGLVRYPHRRAAEGCALALSPSAVM